MVIVRDFFKKLNFQPQLLAGQAGMEDLAKDVVLLNHQEQIWLTREKTDEFEDALVFVQSRMFPGYLSTFDLLVRFLKQAGAVGVLFQGGKRSDFSKATVMLAENLGMPLIWIPEPVTYTVLARQFYAMYLEAQQHTKTLLTCARNHLEDALSDVFTLHAWMEQVEHELSLRDLPADCGFEKETPCLETLSSVSLRRQMANERTWDATRGNDTRDTDAYP